MSSKIKTVIILLLICVIILIIPIAFIKDAEFSGSDTTAQETITELNSNYEPWTDQLIKPPSKEMETLFFCLQAAIGSGIIGYGFGVLSQRAKIEKGRANL